MSWWPDWIASGEVMLLNTTVLSPARVIAPISAVVPSPALGNRSVVPRSIFTAPDPGLEALLTASVKLFVATVPPVKVEL